MKLNLQTGLLSCLVLMMGFQACDNSNDNNGKEVFCTADFRSVVVFVEDEQGHPFLLDSISATFENEELTAMAIDSSHYAHYPEGTPYGYPVITDQWQEFFQNRTEVVNFKGYKNGKEVVSGDIKVTADECHVSSPESDQVLVAVYEYENEEPVFCTEEFRTQFVFVKDKSQNPFVLDSVSTTWNDEVLFAEKVESEYAIQHGAYPVIDDSVQKLFENKSDTVLFKGFVNNVEVVSGKVPVSADRCHINMPDEPATLIVSE